MEWHVLRESRHGRCLVHGVHANLHLRPIHRAVHHLLLRGGRLSCPHVSLCIEIVMVCLWWSVVKRCVGIGVSVGGVDIGCVGVDDVNAGVGSIGAGDGGVGVGIGVGVGGVVVGVVVFVGVVGVDVSVGFLPDPSPHRVSWFHPHTICPVRGTSVLLLAELSWETVACADVFTLARSCLFSICIFLFRVHVSFFMSIFVFPLPPTWLFTPPHLTLKYPFIPHVVTGQWPERLQEGAVRSFKVHDCGDHRRGSCRRNLVPHPGAVGHSGEGLRGKEKDRPHAAVAVCPPFHLLCPRLHVEKGLLWLWLVVVVVVVLVMVLLLLLLLFLLLLLLLLLLLYFHDGSIAVFVGFDRGAPAGDGTRRKVYLA